MVGLGVLESYVEGLARTQRIGRGGKPLVGEDEGHVYEPPLINVRDLLLTGDPKAYLGRCFIILIILASFLFYAIDECL